MTRAQCRAGLLACAALVLLGSTGCGGDEPPSPQPLAVDDTFVTRIVAHQHVALELARSASRDAQTAAVRRLARRMAQSRRRVLPALEEHLARIPADATLVDLGVPAAVAADEVTPLALRRSRPLDPAFLTIMRRHDQGALALVDAELRRGRDPAVKSAAQRLAVALSRELGRLDAALRTHARRPAGR